MLDLYALGDGFPGVPPPPHLTGLQKASVRELAIYQDIVASDPETRPDLRFYPYLQVHEYEGLLFSDPDSLRSRTRTAGSIGPVTRDTRCFRDAGRHQ